jgi:hypothetical protein
LCAGSPVVVVGGGNSAGQAALHLPKQRARPTRATLSGVRTGAAGQRCLTKRLTNSAVLAGRNVIGWTHRYANRLLSVTRWTRRHPLYGRLIAHNPKVANSNPAPATNCAKALVRSPFRKIGRGFDRSRDVFGFSIDRCGRDAFRLVTARLDTLLGNFGLRA